MILCPNCLHKEMIGALFCSECGAQLSIKLEDTTDKFDRASLQGYHATSTPVGSPVPPPPSMYSDAQVSLNIISSGDIIPLTGSKEITIGRISEGQPIIPDVDLSPYQAYESGVSRMHASIRFNDEEILVTDLGSANGTRINGKIIASNAPQSVRHGDILTLGKCKIQILLRDKPNGG